MAAAIRPEMLHIGIELPSRRAGAAVPAGRVFGVGAGPSQSCMLGWPDQLTGVQHGRAVECRQSWPRAAVGADPETRGRLGLSCPTSLAAWKRPRAPWNVSAALPRYSPRASQERRMTSPTAGRIGSAGAHTDHVNPDRAGNKSATFRSGLSPVPAPPGRHKDREWSRRCNQ